VLCIVGPGGSGKSTLLRILERLVAGVDTTTATSDIQLWWQGQVDVTIRECARLRQHGNFSRELVDELLAGAGLDLSWLPTDEAREQLQALGGQPLAEVPDPLRRALSFALVACSSAPLLLFDEPLFALPEPWSTLIRGWLGALAEQGRTAVIVTHHLPLARAVADRVALLADGQLIECGPTEDFFCRSEHPRTRRYLQWGG
ncbi:MAG: amino acid ABC transporter ATP-binding protein, partial [Myxococcales bacterium]|nr:amino acid ABC transporter ATP-binding protein [Myxococcales bacterium]